MEPKYEYNIKNYKFKNEDYIVIYETHKGVKAFHNFVSIDKI